ncbi:PQQ-binding-like beta-propeller repeat protein [Nocardiopsis alborubida]|uniref:PQQ-binding-like beta-propeller repeat protein n=1 Tax=Nocardiopsis alborubida TaxID=146802 RepID=A0A7X6RTQ2_9ACTN|nr:PQQ-binding-like beta-propeller repeat protein [Nocardiopsis alborubida]NKZ01919.1 PQQ-binding-like beta-propeller repeat protein [Nocardiopsis alborubida]
MNSETGTSPGSSREGGAPEAGSGGGQRDANAPGEPPERGEGPRSRGDGAAPRTGDRPGPRRAARPLLSALLAWAGTGLVAGALPLSVVLLFLRDPEEGLGPGPSLLVAFPAGLALLVLVLRRPVPGKAGPDRGPGSPLRLTALAAGAVLLSYLAYRSFPRDAFARLTENGDTWTPSVTGSLQWVALCAFALGFLALLLAVRRPRPRPGGRAWTGFAAGVLAVAAAGWAAVSEATHQPVEHVVAAPGAAPGTPTAVTRVGWTWEGPEDTRVERVVAGPRGPVVLLGDGMVGLDGATGEELWTYRLPFGWHTSAGASMGGDLAYVSYRQDPDDSGSGRMTVVDTATGEITREVAAPPEERFGTGDHHFLGVLPTGSLHTGSDEEPGTLVAYGDAGEGGLWTFTPQDPESACDTERRVLLHEGLILAAYLCRGEPDVRPLVVLGLDARTGEQRWRTEVGDPYPSGSLRIFWEEHAVSEGEHPVVGVGSDSGPVTLLDPRTGAVAGEFPEFLLEDDDGASQEYRVIRSGYRGRVHADTGGAVHVEGGGHDEYLVHHVDPSGALVRTTVVPEPPSGLDDPSDAVAVGDTLLVPHEEQEVRGGDPSASVRVVPLGEERGASEDGGTVIGIGSAVDLRLLPVPGAVTAHGLEETTTVYGLVP